MLEPAYVGRNRRATSIWFPALCFEIGIPNPIWGGRLAAKRDSPAWSSAHQPVFLTRRAVARAKL